MARANPGACARLGRQASRSRAGKTGVGAMKPPMTRAVIAQARASLAQLLLSGGVAASPYGEATAPRYE
jgi:hypothetical protein